jgi:uroporphyrinogen-III synthase
MCDMLFSPLSQGGEQAVFCRVLNERFAWASVTSSGEARNVARELPQPILNLRSRLILL